MNSIVFSLSCKMICLYQKKIMQALAQVQVHILAVKLTFDWREMDAERKQR